MYAAEDESDSERGYMLRTGSRNVAVADKSWSWQCQAVAYAFVVLLLALNLISFGSGSRESTATNIDIMQTHRKIVAIGGGQAADKPWIRDTIIAMSGKDTPNVLYIGTPGFDVLSGYQRQAAGFQKLGFRTAMLNLTDLTKVPSADERGECCRRIFSAIFVDVPADPDALELTCVAVLAESIGNADIIVVRCVL